MCVYVCVYICVWKYFVPEKSISNNNVRKVALAIFSNNASRVARSTSATAPILLRTPTHSFSHARVSRFSYLYTHTQTRTSERTSVLELLISTVSSWPVNLRERMSHFSGSFARSSTTGEMSVYDRTSPLFLGHKKRRMDNLPCLIILDDARTINREISRAVSAWSDRRRER